MLEGGIVIILVCSMGSPRYLKLGTEACSCGIVTMKSSLFNCKLFGVV